MSYGYHFPHGRQGHPIEVLHDMQRRAALQPPGAGEPAATPPAELAEARRRQGVRAAALIERFLRDADPARQTMIPIDAWEVPVPARRRTLAERWNGTGSFWSTWTEPSIARVPDHEPAYVVYARQDRDYGDPPPIGRVQVVVFTDGQVGITVSGTCVAGGVLSRSHEVVRYQRIGPLRRPPEGPRPWVYTAGSHMEPGELPFYRGTHETAGPWPGRGCTPAELDDAVEWLGRQLRDALQGPVIP